MNKIIKKGLKIILLILAIFVGLIIIWSITNQILNVIEKKKAPPMGDFVTVDNKKMSVYCKGEGKHTILLMSGLGTTAPILDFKPLIDKLSVNNKVVVVEPFGYGWSDLTDKERSVDNIIEEMRIALKAKNILGPYVLMPHSVSGIYATYYSNKYPDEVSGIVGIDCTLPSQLKYFEEKDSGNLPVYSKLVCPLGISRVITIISPNTFISKNIDNTYSNENLQMQKIISARQGYNKTIINETNYINKNIETTLDMKFDSDLPLLFFTTPESKRKHRDDGKTSVSFYKTYITNDNCQQVMEMDGTHYLHWSCSESMADKVESFLK